MVYAVACRILCLVKSRNLKEPSRFVGRMMEHHSMFVRGADLAPGWMSGRIIEYHERIQWLVVVVVSHARPASLVSRAIVCFEHPEQTLDGMYDIMSRVINYPLAPH